jgi:hypothetical protein
VGRFSIGRAVTDLGAPCRHQIERLEKRFYHNVEPIRIYAVAGLHRQPVKQGDAAVFRARPHRHGRDLAGMLRLPQPFDDRLGFGLAMLGQPGAEGGAFRRAVRRDGDDDCSLSDR